MLDRIAEDVRTAKANDPAASSTLAVLLTYPGLHAVWCYRIANRIDRAGFDLLAHLVAYVGRFLTGVEIHPSATVGDRLFIDHGMGTVVGQTTEIGDDVVMYHGVTLGGKSSDPVKRHPTLEDGVTIGADATLIGDITVGENAVVGASAVVVDDVAPNTTVVGNPARPIHEDEAETAENDVTESDTDEAEASVTADDSGREEEENVHPDCAPPVEQRWREARS